MPHQCVRCNTFYDDGAMEIIKGCKCGARLFFFVKKEALKKAKEITADLSNEQKVQIEDDVFDILGIEQKDEPVVLDLESVRVSGPGKFELDVVQLFNKDNPVVFKLDEGKYMIDVAASFERHCAK